LRIDQQRDILMKFYSWFISGKYIFEGVDNVQMEQFDRIKVLNATLPAFKEIYDASSISGTGGLDRAKIDMCRSYYRHVLEYLPQLQEAHLFFGFCEYKDGNMEAAFNENRLAMGSASGTFWSSYNLGIMCAMNGHHQLAKDFLLMVLDLPAEDVLKNMLASRLFQQYIVANQLTVQELFEDINGARSDAADRLRVIQGDHASTLSSPGAQQWRLRIL